MFLGFYRPIVCLTGGQIQCRYADAVSLCKWRQSQDTDPLTREKIICSNYYGFEYVDDKLDIAYLGTDDEVKKQGTLLHLLLNYSKFEDDEENLANHWDHIGDIYNSKKDNRALKWYEKAGDKGNNEALWKLGCAHRDARNWKEAKRWYKILADKNGEGSALAGAFLEQLL